MTPVVSYYRTGGSEAWISQKLDDNSVFIHPRWHSFYSIWYVINGYQNELIAERSRKGSHKIDAPHIENFHFQDWGKGHHILTCDSTRHLTSCTEFAKIVGVLKESGPVEHTLQNFLSSLAWIKVSTACKFMTKSQHTMVFILRKAPSNDLIRAIFE